MFSLTQADLQLRIVNCAAGPASFDAELSAEGHRVISCDSLFSLSPDEIRSRIDAAYDTVVTNGRTATDEFVWREFTSPEHLGEARMAAMRRFLAGTSRRGRRSHVTSTGYSPTSGFVAASSTWPLLAHAFHLLRLTLRRFPRRRHRGDVPGRGRGARLPAAEKLRRTVAVSEAGSGPVVRPRLPHRGQKSSLRVSARRRRDARGEDNRVARDRLRLAGVLSLRTSQMRPAAGQTC
jgi:hypothetical protein